METDTDEDWVFSSDGSGWEDKNNKPNIEGPTAEQIRNEYDAITARMDQDKRAHYFTSAGIPNGEIFSNYTLLTSLLTQDTENVTRKESGQVQIASFGKDAQKAVKEAGLYTFYATRGVWNGIKGSALEALELVQHPVQTAKAVGEIGKALGMYYQTGDTSYLLPITIPLAISFEKEVERWKEGDKYERTEQVGEYVGGALVAVVGTKGIGTGNCQDSCRNFAKICIGVKKAVF